MDKLIFFDFKRNKFINIFIIIQIAIWFFCMTSLVSLLRFEDSYTERFDRSFSLDKSFTITFDKMMLNLFEDVDKYPEIIKMLDKEKIEYGLGREYIQPEDEIIPEELGMNKKYFKKNFTTVEFMDERIHPIVINYTLVEKYKNNIKGNINKEEWKTEDNITPIILGKDFMKDYKIGDTLSYKDKKFKIIGFFKESILIPSRGDLTSNPILTDGNIIFPIENEYDTEKYSFQPIIVYFDKNSDENLNILSDKLKTITDKFTIKRPSDDLENMFKDLNDDKLFEIIRVLIISIISASAIAITIIYLILTNKQRIGILYSVGCSKNKVSKIMFKEFSLFAIVGITIGSIFYTKNGLNVFAYFLNENIISNEIIAMCILITFMSVVFSLSIRYINKLTPRELIGGFRE